MQVEHMSLKDEKAALRIQFREQRQRFAKDNGPQATAALHENLKRWKRDLGGQYTQICAYRPIGDEVDPCVQPVTELFFPRLEGSTLKFWRPSQATAFAKGKLGIS